MPTFPMTIKQFTCLGHPKLASTIINQHFYPLLRILSSNWGVLPRPRMTVGTDRASAHNFPGVFSLGNPNHFSCGQLKMVLNHIEKPTVEPTITLISLMFKSCLSHVQVMFKSCLSHVQVMLSHVQVMFKSCLSHVQVMLSHV